MILTQDYLDLVNSTYRNSSAIGRANVVPRAVGALLASGALRPRTILDFGSGKDADDAEAFRAMGFDVTATDVGRNFVPGVHDPAALERQYDLVYASNVLNVQPTVDHLAHVIDTLARAVAPGGALVANYYPRTKHARFLHEVEPLLRGRFGAVERVRGEKSPVWICSMPVSRRRQRCSCRRR
jgi:2-polyprenyl-3-methyl-5-hydroxy-6-metoxy-1,4-benzoquinol methylase